MPRIQLTIIGDSERVDLERDFESTIGMYTQGHRMLRDALGVAFGPHVVADDLVDEQSGF